MLETEDLAQAKDILRNAAVFPDSNNVWKLLIIDTAGGWGKRVEDGKKDGIWVYKVLYRDEKEGWNQYKGE